MKTARLDGTAIDEPRERTAEERREGRARAKRIIALAESGISGTIGRTDITNLTEEEFVENCRRLMPRG